MLQSFFDNLNNLKNKYYSVFDAYFKSYSKKNKRKLDDEIKLVAEKYIQEIDCLLCGNCCKTLSPIITDNDIAKLAKADKKKQGDFLLEYLVIDKVGDYVYKQSPCPFLLSDNYCIYYNSRPKACKEYPHLLQSNQFKIKNLTLKNAFVCPIVFYTLKELTEHIS